MAEQLAFGTPFDPTPQDARKVQDLLAGKLELPPNPTWQLPSEITWYENPFKEPNWVAQFHMLRWIDPLRRQAQRGQHELIDRWLEIAESWIEKNPPGRGRATYSWADMIEAARAMTFTFALPAIEDLRPEKLPVILRSLEEHGAWLAEPSHIRTGNHALQQHQGLLIIGAVLRRTEWVDLAIARAEQMLESSYDHQGVNEEGAVQYHQINYLWWNALRRRVLLVTGSAPDAFHRIARAPLAMAHATRPDGRYELIGDTEEFTPRGLGHAAIDYVSSGGADGVAPRDRVAVFDAGYVFGRSTWGDRRESFADASFYSLRFGPQNRIHGNADGMALTLWAGRESLLVDSGKLAYDAKDPYRAHLLAREAHNSVSVDGADYDRTVSVELTVTGTHDDFEVHRFEDRGYDGVVLTRTILISLTWNVAVVVDAFTAQREVSVSQWWHLSPAASHRKETDTVVTRTLANELRFAWPTGTASPRVVRGSRSPVQGWFSPTWRVLEPTRVIEVRSSGTSGRIVTALSFTDAKAPRPLSVAATEAEEGLWLRLDRGDGDRFSALLGDEDAVLVRGERSAAQLAHVLR
jgi:hypothetical protein